ncbi:MAG: hypothetical protein ACKVT2_22235, partial [Saprospiraceae bacterium]
MDTFDTYEDFLIQQHNTTIDNATLKSAISSANALVDIAKSANDKLDKFPNFDGKISSDINVKCQNKEEVDLMIVEVKDRLLALDIQINSIEPKFQELYKIIKGRTNSKIQVQREHLETA